jgi:hypothetical protein
MIRSHCFNGRVYKIHFAKYIGGVTDVPGGTESYHMVIVDGNELTHLDNALHEGLEAMGAPDELLHNKDGTGKTEDLARFLWRLGYRKVKKAKRK